MQDRIPAAELERFAAGLLSAAGVPADAAAIWAGVLVWADLREVDSHGVGRLGQYLQWLAAGIINPRPALRFEALGPSLLRLAADRAAGPVAMTAAVEALRGMVAAQGIGAVVVSQMTHSGPLGHYTAAAAEAGIACIAINAGIPLIPYHGTRAPALGTNPLSIAVPASDQPLVFDMAASAIALGKLVNARRLGAALPPGSAMDGEGRVTTDAAAAQMVLPLGGAKGSGLALMIECLASLLGGNPLIASALELPPGQRRHSQNALLIGLDVTRFLPLAEFTAQIARLGELLRLLPLAEGSDSIQMPGERGFAAMARNRIGGVPINRKIYHELQALADKVGVPLPPLHASPQGPEKAEPLQGNPQ